MSYKEIIISVIVSVMLSLSVASLVKTDTSVGAGFDAVVRTFSAGVKIGASGTQLSNIAFGTCNLVGPTTIAATSTANFTCTATGVKSGDTVQLQAPATQANGFIILGASASTTNGFITVRLQNASTTGTTLPTNSTSSFMWRAYR